MPLKPSKKSILLSGNGNRPTVNMKLGLIHIDIHIHDVISIVKLALGVAAVAYFMKHLEKKPETE